MSQEITEGNSPEETKVDAAAVSSEVTGSATGEVEGEEENLSTVEESALPELLGALLLAHGEPLSLTRLTEISKHDEEKVASALELLKTRFSTEYKLGFALECVAGAYQLRTQSKFAPFIRQLKATRPRRLSAAALETLAIIAYRQPIVKSDIEGLRGVDSSPTLKTLLERKLIRIVGHQPTVGQPALYGTTEEFLRVFGLETLGALPTLREVKEIEAEPGEVEETAPESAQAVAAQS